MASMGGKRTDRIYCTLHAGYVFLSPGDFDRYDRANRLVQAHGTGIAYMGDSSRWDAEYVTTECDECARSGPRRATVPEQMAHIRRHVAEMMSRGVAADDAIRVAVTAQMIRSEVRVSPRFVAEMCGLTDLLEGLPDDEAQDATPGPALTPAEAANGWTPPAGMTGPTCASISCESSADVSCSECAVYYCARHLIVMVGINGAANRLVCRYCRERIEG